MNTKTDENQNTPAPEPKLSAQPALSTDALIASAMTPKSNPDSITDQHRARRRGVDVDVTQAGATMSRVSKFGEAKPRALNIAEFMSAWSTLFNEQVISGRLIDDLQGVGVKMYAPEKLYFYLFAVKKRVVAEPGDERLRCLVVVKVADGVAGDNPVAQYLITTEPLNGNRVFKPQWLTDEPVRAASFYRLRANEDVLANYELYDETIGATGPTEEMSGHNATEPDRVVFGKKPARSAPRLIELPPRWLYVGDLARRWPEIFNEEDLGCVVISRLGDLEKNQDGQIVLRLVKPNPGHVIMLQVFKDTQMPGFDNTIAPFIVAKGVPVEPLDVIRIHTSIVEGVEQAVKLEVSDNFVASQHAPKGSPEDTAKQFTGLSAAASQLTPSDMRSFDPVMFQLFVDQVRQAAISPQDQERLVAFVEFIAKCQQIEKTLFFHCTALGRQLDLMLGAGRRHFPGAQTGMSSSVFATGGRWSDAASWGQKTQQQTTPAAMSFVQANQLGSDVVISVYNATGVLLGVFQAAVAHSYPA